MLITFSPKGHVDKVKVSNILENKNVELYNDMFNPFLEKWQPLELDRMRELYTHGVLNNKKKTGTQDDGNWRMRGCGEDRHSIELWAILANVTSLLYVPWRNEGGTGSE
eukprot:GHVU01010769.1.p6 GENE.GHVU01010769.1~~GHVU01010769.1.p6  ORF type:complete len:109 (+),score=10.72 GHVU01010769.1:1871-2197(+)